MMNIKKAAGIAVASVAIVGMTGCASIMSGKEQQISVNSNVQGATIELNGVEIGKTPFIGKVKKPENADGNILTLSAPGYETKKVNVSTNIEPSFWVNILSGGPFGSTTDYASHSMYKLGDGTFQVDLQKK